MGFWTTTCIVAGLFSLLLSVNSFLWRLEQRGMKKQCLPWVVLAACSRVGSGRKLCHCCSVVYFFPPQLLKCEDSMCWHRCSSPPPVLRARRGKRTVFSSSRTLHNLINAALILPCLLTACVWVLKNLSESWRLAHLHIFCKLFLSMIPGVQKLYLFTE